MDCGELPKFVLNILSLGPKYPVRHNCNEVHLLADVDKLYMNYARINEASAKWYAKDVRETPMDRGGQKSA